MKQYEIKEKGTGNLSPEMMMHMQQANQQLLQQIKDMEELRLKEKKEAEERYQLSNSQIPQADTKRTKQQLYDLWNSPFHKGDFVEKWTTNQRTMTSEADYRELEEDL